MDDFRIKKIVENILLQSRLSKNEANDLAKEINASTNWDEEFDYASIVNKELEKRSLLRTQVQKSCKIRDNTRLK